MAENKCNIGPPSAVKHESHDESAVELEDVNMKISLQLKANLENVTNLRPDGDDFRWYIKVTCSYLAKQGRPRPDSSAFSAKATRQAVRLRERWYQGTMVPEQLYHQEGMMVKCASCGEETPEFVYLSLLENQPLKGGRGSASMVLKCKLCSRENSIDILKDTIQGYNDSDFPRFKSVVTFECRGVEPTDFSPRCGFIAEGPETGSKFEVDLAEGDWSDFDEKNNEPVGVYEIESQFVRAK